jgi:SAM-dependent methyltransferase
MSGDTYIHGTSAEEQRRLAALNRMTNSAFIQFLSVAPRTRILEVGSGLGILAAEVAAAADGAQVVGLEQSAKQIAAAVKAPNLRFVQGDAHRLDFPDGSFDLVYARYLLEHVAAPETVLSEMRRVVRPGGRVAACENDISLLRLDPPCPTFDEVWDAFQRYQRTLGGDAQIGRRLHRLLRGAGLSRVELSVQPEVHWHGSEGFSAWIENLRGNIEGARQGLLQSGLCDEEQVGTAVGELTDLSRNSDASSCFVWNRALAVR